MKFNYLIILFLLFFLITDQLYSQNSIADKKDDPTEERTEISNIYLLQNDFISNGYYSENAVNAKTDAKSEMKPIGTKKNLLIINAFIFMASALLFLLISIRIKRISI